MKFCAGDKTMGDVWKTIGKAAGILLVAPILGILTLTLVYCVPLKEEKLLTANDVLHVQNSTPDYPVMYAWAQNYFTYRPGVLDGLTATLIFRYSSMELVENNPLKTAAMEEYPRYWHGYALIMRPLLAIFEYGDIEILFSFVILMMAIGIGAVIGKRKGLPYVFAFCTSFLLLMPMAVGLCTQYIWIVLITYGALIFFLTKEAWLNEKQRYLFFFLILGILTNYFDFLTYPIYTWGLPAIWWLLLEKKERNAKQALRFVVFSAIAWALGYGGMWIGKWLVGSVILGQNLFADGLEQILFRSGIKDSLTLRERLYSAYKNWKHYSFVLYALMIGAWLTLFLITGFLRGLRWNAKAPAYGLAALSSFAWNMVAANHMEVHHYFTYRIYGVAVMAWLALILVATEKREAKQKTDGKEKWRYLAVMTAVAVMAFGMMQLMKEEREVSNKGYPEFEQIVLESGNFEMLFVPEGKRITQVCFAMGAEIPEGDYVVRLMDGDQLLYEERIPVAHFEGDVYKLYPVDWKVKPRKEYSISVETPQNGGLFKGFISIEDTGMSEVGLTTLNGDLYDGEALFGLSYWDKPSSGKLRLFWWMTWVLVFSVVAYFGMNGKNWRKGELDEAI